MADYTTVGLLASIRRRASIPTTSTTGGASADLLAYANEELRLGLISEVLRLREGYFLRNSDTTISSSTTSYRVPTRAIGGKLAAVQLLDSGGNVVATLPEYSVAREADLQGSTGLMGYIIEGGFIRLVPGAVTTATTLRLKYYAQPNELVSSGYATITVIASNVVTTSSSHGYTTASTLDVVRATEGFESLAIDQTPTAASGTSITFSAAVTGWAVGDYVPVARQSPVPQIPSEFHPILAQRVACAYLEANGAPELAAAKAKLAEMQAAIGILASPRVDTGLKKIVPRYGPLGVIRRRRALGT